MSGQFDLSTVEQYERLEILNLPERGLISHVVIAGGGRNGFSIAELFHRIRLSLVLIDIDYRTVERAKLVGIPVVYGDAGQEIVLEAAEIRTARLLIVAIPGIVLQRSIIETARRLNSALPVVT